MDGGKLSKIAHYSPPEGLGLPAGLPRCVVQFWTDRHRGRL